MIYNKHPHFVDLEPKLTNKRYKDMRGSRGGRDAGSEHLDFPGYGLLKSKSVGTIKTQMV